MTQPRGPQSPPLAPPRLDELDDDQRRLAEAILDGPRAGSPFPLTDATGRLAGPFGVFLHSPVVGEALQELGARLRYRGNLPAPLREIAVLTVAIESGSAFEWWAHRRVGREIGLDSALLDRLERGEALADPTDRAVQQAARR
jgi:4-carboxymuconolactone decarboxylase